MKVFTQQTISSYDNILVIILIIIVAMNSCHRKSVQNGCSLQETTIHKQLFKLQEMCIDCSHASSLKSFSVVFKLLQKFPQNCVSVGEMERQEKEQFWYF